VRIGIDCRIAHYTSGGTAVYTRRLVEALLHLPEAGGESWLLLEAAAASKPVLESLPGNARRRLLRTPSHYRWEQVSLPLELALAHLHVLHSPDYIPPLVRRCRSVITVHDLAFLRWPELLTSDSRRYFNGHIRRAVRSADRIIAVSRATKHDLMELLGVSPDRIDVVYEAPAFELPGANRGPRPSGVSSQAPRPNSALPEDYILFIGMLEPRKNLVRLIEAFANVKRRGYPGVLLLAGSPGWLAEPILEAVRQHSAYVFIQPVDLRGLPELYRRARLLAFPSLYEGFGLPLLEAMACGTPVLTSNVSSLPEIAGDAALLVDPNDAGAIAAGIWQLLKDEALREVLRAKGLARAKEFSWQRAARETLEVYHRAAAGSVHSPGTC
jgi:glycosyltransferase involved in cell wall biosynthesis